MRTSALLILLGLVITSCGSKDSSTSSESSTATSVVARTVSESEYTSAKLSMIRQPKVENSLMSMLIPKAFADGFVNLSPIFAPYYENFSTSFDDNSGDMKDTSYKGVYCNGANTSKDCLKDNLTIYPRIAHANYSTATQVNETTSIVNFVENKYYHLTVARLGGGVFSNQAPTVELVKYVSGSWVTATSSHCGLEIQDISNIDGYSKGDIIIKTDSVTANSGNYYSADYAEDNTDDNAEGVCAFNVYGTFGTMSLAQSEGKKIAIGKILDTDTSNVYPDIYNGTVTFNGENVTETKVTIQYEDFVQKLDNSGSTYKYGTWTVTAASGSSTIDQSFWQFTCGGGGSEGKWLNTATDNGRLNNHITKVYADYYDIDGDGTIEGISGGVSQATDDDHVADVKKFYWRVGGCNEMLMMVSVKDSNNIMVQRKIAMISE